MSNGVIILPLAHWPDFAPDRIAHQILAARSARAGRTIWLRHIEQAKRRLFAQGIEAEAIEVALRAYARAVRLAQADQLDRAAARARGAAQGPWGDCQ